MSELKFASVNEALQYLSDLSGKSIRIAAGTFERTYEIKNMTGKHFVR